MTKPVSMRIVRSEPNRSKQGPVRHSESREKLEQADYQDDAA